MDGIDLAVVGQWIEGEAAGDDDADGTGAVEKTQVDDGLAKLAPEINRAGLPIVRAHVGNAQHGRRRQHAADNGEYGDPAVAHYAWGRCWQGGGNAWREPGQDRAQLLKAPGRHDEETGEHQQHEGRHKLLHALIAFRGHQPQDAGRQDQGQDHFHGLVTAVGKSRRRSGRVIVEQGQRRRGHHRHLPHADKQMHRHHDEQEQPAGAGVDVFANQRKHAPVFVEQADAAGGIHGDHQERQHQQGRPQQFITEPGAGQDQGRGGASA